jgi:hypothetical protein
MDSITKAPTESEIREQFKLTRMGDEAKLLIGKWLHDYQQLGRSKLSSNPLILFKLADEFGYSRITLRLWRRGYEVSVGLRLPPAPPAVAPALPDPPPAIEGRALPADRTRVAPEPAYEEGATCSGEITREGYTMSFPNHGEFLVSTDEHAGGKYLGEVCECFLGRLPLDKFEAMYLEVRDSVPYPEDTDKMWLHLKTQIQWRTQ